jgi:hypothetical protein
MKTTQAWVWLTAAVMAAGLNASYHDGGLQWAHQVAEQVGHSTRAVLALATGRADQFLSEAQMTARDEAASSRASAAWAQVPANAADDEAGFAWAQAKVADGGAGMARVEGMSARQDARLARIECVRARIEARVAARAARCRVARIDPAALVQIVAPLAGPRGRVNVPRMKAIRIPAVEIPAIQIPAIQIPAVHAEMAGAGPV